jgi:hypothetical protein
MRADASSLGGAGGEKRICFQLRARVSHPERSKTQNQAKKGPGKNETKKEDKRRQ